ncbi:hypothetical protein Tco_1070801 [Tanacetum coccineum]|uniref:Uncharacterized protein n=1 Tax=Tanacetum coccineum TaxID=301880 RepID=A0ABQ5HNT7_9ASTR
MTNDVCPKQLRPRSSTKLTFEQRSSSLVLHQMNSDHNRSELRIHDHSNEPSSSKLVPKVVPLAVKTATSRQELELLFHHHIAMLRTTEIEIEKDLVLEDLKSFVGSVVEEYSSSIEKVQLQMIILYRFEQCRVSVRYRYQISRNRGALGLIASVGAAEQRSLVIAPTWLLIHQDQGQIWREDDGSEVQTLRQSISLIAWIETLYVLARQQPDYCAVAAEWSNWQRGEPRAHPFPWKKVAPAAPRHEPLPESAFADDFSR